MSLLWTQHVHKDTGEKYWFNGRTGKSQARRPVSLQKLDAKDLDLTRWDSFYDKNQKRFFYYDRVNDVTTWEEPIALKIRRSVKRYGNTNWSSHKDRQSGKPFFYNRATGRSQWRKPREVKTVLQTAIWQENYDRMYGELYYFNEALDILCWTSPKIAAAKARVRFGFSSSWAELIDAASNRPFYFNCNTCESTWIRPRNCSTVGGGHRRRERSTKTVWKIKRDREGRIYYANRETGTIRWLPPCWECVRDLVTGRHYYHYHNEATNVHKTQWQRPGLETSSSASKENEGKEADSRSVDHVRRQLVEDVLKQLNRKFSNNEDGAEEEEPRNEDDNSIEVTRDTARNTDGVEVSEFNFVEDNKTVPRHEDSRSSSHIDNRHSRDATVRSLESKFSETRQLDLRGEGTTGGGGSREKVSVERKVDAANDGAPSLKDRVLDFKTPAPFERIPLAREKASEKSEQGCARMRQCLEMGGIVLLHFSRTRRGKERFKFKLCERKPRAGEAMTMEKEYARFKKSVKGLIGDEFESKKKTFMARRHLEYLDKLDELQRCANGDACIAVFRLQDEPDDPFLPPKFGDLIVVWCPNRGTMRMSMDDRMVTVPQTVEAVEAFLDRNRVALPRKLRRSAGGPDMDIMTRQNIGDPLEYSYIYHKLFQRAETHDLTEEKRRQIYKERFEWKPPKTAKPVRRSKKDRAKEEEAQGPFPSTGRLVHNFDPLVANVSEEDLARDKWQQRKLRNALLCGNLVAFEFCPHDKHAKHDSWSYACIAISRVFTGLDGKRTTEQGTSYEKEYDRWKRAMKKKHKIGEIDAAFSEARKSLCEARKREFFLALETLQSTYPSSPRIVVLRVQKQTEGYRQPAVFADVIIVWNPLIEGPKKRKMTMRERSQTAAPTVASIVGFLEGGVVLPIHKRRQGLSVTQKPGCNLYYDELYQKLFGKRPKHFEE